MDMITIRPLSIISITSFHVLRSSLILVIPDLECTIRQLPILLRRFDRIGQLQHVVREVEHVANHELDRLRHAVRVDGLVQRITSVEELVQVVH